MASKEQIFMKCFISGLVRGIIGRVTGEWNKMSRTFFMLFKHSNFPKDPSLKQKWNNGRDSLEIFFSFFHALSFFSRNPSIYNSDWDLEYKFFSL